MRGVVLFEGGGGGVEEVEFGAFGCVAVVAAEDVVPFWFCAGFGFGGAGGGGVVVDEGAEVGCEG